jgi:hypothetical protein
LQLIYKVPRSLLNMTFAVSIIAYLNLYLYPMPICRLQIPLSFKNRAF